MKKRLKKIFKKSLLLNKGHYFSRYYLFKKIPKICHQSLINLHILTNGSYLNFIYKLISKKTLGYSYKFPKFFGIPEEYDFQK